MNELDRLYLSLNFINKLIRYKQMQLDELISKRKEIEHSIQVINYFKEKYDLKSI